MPPSRDGAHPNYPQASLAALLIALLTALLPNPALTSQIATDQASWLRQVEPIITDEERHAFEQLSRNYQREAFIARFWRQRDPRPETAENEFLEEWRRRLTMAEEQFGGLDSDRARAMLLIGLPELILGDLCPELLRPLEAWYYPASESFPEGFFLFFLLPTAEAGGPIIQWAPDESSATLFESISTPAAGERRSWLIQRCTRGREADRALDLVIGWQDLADAGDVLPSPPEPWVDEFLDRTTDLDPETPALTAALELRYPGQSGEKTVVQMEITIPSEVAVPTAGDQSRFSLRLDGEVLRRETLFDQFRFDFELPVLEIQDDAIPLAFQRDLLPGDYTLILRLLDRVSGHAFRSEGPLHVPAPEATGPLPDDALAEANAILGTGDHRIKILPLPEQLLTGRVRVEAQAMGGDIGKVSFVLNDRPVMSKTRPPYSLEIDLGHAPRLHWLEAIALDVGGQELARDRVPINAGPHRFSVRLVEPRSGERYIGSLRAAAEVHLPAGEELEKVDFYLNETRLASLYQPPFVQPLALPQNRRITYVRAVAYLVDGNATEDLVFVNAPKEMAHLRINMVELFTTVSDKKGQPVEGLTAEDFTVHEEGERQALHRFELVQDLSIHAGVILDASTSMQEELEEAVAGALEFFDGVIQPKDRAAVVVFNDEPVLKVPFTNSLEVLTEGLEDVESEGETVLYDTLVYALHYFAGIRGKRALVLLSDGEDSASSYSFAETLEFAQRSGVAIYTIALGLDRRQVESRNVLQRLARETGGGFFSIASARELEKIYAAIERELRSQYLLAYQSTHEVGGDFRRVEVDVAADGLKVKTIPGYYP